MFLSDSLGQILEFDYYSRRLLDKGPTKRRRVLLSARHDLRQVPIFISAWLANPYLLRTLERWEGYDYYCFGLRNFYDLDAAPCRLQLAVFDPASGRCLRRVGEPYEQTCEGIHELIGTCENIMKDERLRAIRTSVAIFAAA